MQEMGSPITPLAALLGDVRAATAFRYDARDSAGNRMDTAKVIQARPAAIWPSTTAAGCATSPPLPIS